MGQTLSEPVRDKNTSETNDHGIISVTSSMQGWRIDMQDCHATKIPIDDRHPDVSFFGIYDGHGGPRVAKLAAEYLHRTLVEQPSFAEKNYKQAIIDGILRFDENLLEEMGLDFQSQGSTATVCLITPDSIFTGNVGDSSAFACVNGDQLHKLTVDHRPENVEEVARIWAAGGYVSNGRVNGNLAMSRALGDFCYKKNIQKQFKDQIVSSLADVSELNVPRDKIDFILMASDGIWEVMDERAVLDFIKDCFARKLDQKQICEQLMDHCIAHDADVSTAGFDNMTVSLIMFRKAAQDDSNRNC